MVGSRGKGIGKDGRRLMSQPRGIHVDAVGILVIAGRHTHTHRLVLGRFSHVFAACALSDLHAAEDGSLYVADFGSYCIFRYAADDARGQVVAGEDGKQLMDVDYLKDISMQHDRCSALEKVLDSTAAVQSRTSIVRLLHQKGTASSSRTPLTWSQARV